MSLSIHAAGAIAPTKPAAGYIGGKKNLARTIVPLIDRAGLAAYAEPFVGMGGIFLRRRRPAAREFVNDISGDVVTFLRIVREHHGFLMDTLRWLVASRAEFARQLALPPEHLTDLQRAARFLYVQRLAFGGKVSGRNFGASPGQAARFNVLRLERDLAELHDRLAHVVIERLSFEVFIRGYDRDDVLFYLDPPYWGCEHDYGAKVFDRADFERLAAQLAGIRGRFLLSLNDTPGVRETFAAFPMREVTTTYMVAGKGNSRRAGELLIGTIALD